MAAFTLFSNCTTAINLPGKIHESIIEEKSNASLGNELNTFSGLHIHIATHLQYPFKAVLQQQEGWQKIVIKDSAQSSGWSKLLADQPQKKSPDTDFKSQDCHVKIINIKKTPISEIIDNIVKIGQVIDFLTIDLSALHSNALNSYNWTKHSPSFVILNGANDGSNKTRNTATRFLLKRKYRQVSTLSGMLVFKLKP